jgi:hypothetical protein
MEDRNQLEIQLENAINYISLHLINLLAILFSFKISIDNGGTKRRDKGCSF